MKKATRAKSSQAQIEAARKEFVGAQMANLLHFISGRLNCPENVRQDAKKLQERWDAVSNLRLNNPIVIAELEKQFGFTK